MRKALLVVAAVALLHADLAEAQARRHGRIPRTWLATGIGMAVGGTAAFIYASARNPDLSDTCTSSSCVTTVSIVAGFVSGFLIGRELDQLYKLRYRHAPPLTLRGQSMPLSILPNDISSRGGAITAAGDGGVEVVMAGPRLERGDVRARGLRGVIAALPDPAGNHLFVSTGSGLYGFALSGERVAGSLLVAGEVSAVALRNGNAVLIHDGTIKSARVDGDSLVAVSPPRAFESRATDVAWDPERPVVWVLTETALVALAASDAGLGASVGALPLPGTGRRLAVRGTTIAVAASEGGVLLVDATDPQAPRQTAAWSLSRFAYDVALGGSSVYLAAGPEGLYVLEPRADGSLSPIGLARGLGFISALETEGANLLLLDRTGGLLRSNPFPN